MRVSSFFENLLNGKGVEKVKGFYDRTGIFAAGIRYKDEHPDAVVHFSGMLIDRHYLSGTSWNNSPTGTSSALESLSSVSNLIDIVLFVIRLLKFL